MEMQRLIGSLRGQTERRPVHSYGLSVIVGADLSAKEAHPHEVQRLIGSLRGQTERRPVHSYGLSPLPQVCIAPTVTVAIAPAASRRISRQRATVMRRALRRAPAF
ncbi:hypothetical protein SAMN05216593_105246 [Pseudomonas asturiensis]|uniref:Uncharacterized protein n=1 Tax=Pseudomonas asturiensis TaxID=1190415 RepID=A0A1M7N6Z9_9PSED|nr:hypothetical protein SAMN05216593_105246 [Pseudomonas asturiensis]